MGRLSTELAGWTLDNPILPASGTFGYGLEFAQFYDLNVLGSIAIKGTTLNPRYGNPCPRIAECAQGMLNSVGLQNPGVDAVLEKELPELGKIFHKKVVANISGFSIEEYVEVARRLSASDQVGILEVNISCPNVAHGGMSFGTDPVMAKAVTQAVKAVSTKPVFVKLSPNVTDIVAIAKACEEGGADGLCLINTLLGMRIDIRTGKPILANKTGGVSGPCIFPVAVRCVYQVYEAVSIPIIGMGGVTTAEDAVEMMMAGASAVEVGAANCTDPYACKKIIEDLPRVLDEIKAESVKELIGRAHK